MKLSDFFHQTYRPLRLRGKSPNTSRLYECLFRQFGRFLRRDPLVSDLDDLGICGFLEWRSLRGRSPYTVEKERSQLVALGRLARDRGLLQTAPIVYQGTLPETVPTAWTVAELASLFRAAESMPGAICNAPAGLWWAALLHVAWESSERIGALMALERHHVANNALVVPASARKGRRRERIYHLSTDTAARVAALLEAHGEPNVFPWDKSATYLWNRMKRIKTLAGLPAKKRVAFHMIRRSAASHFAAAGGDAARFLGHYSPRMTERWYLDPRVCDTGPKPCDLLPRID